MAVEFDVFLSYARADDEPFVRRLHEDLGARGIRVWWDKRRMESRGTSFRLELRDAIAAVDRVVLVVGPAAVTSEYVAAEWEFGLELCKIVVPVLRLGSGFELVPKRLEHLHAIDFRDDARYNDALDELTRLLSSPVPPLAAVGGVDALPPHYQPREAVNDSVRRAVLADAVAPDVVTTPHKTIVIDGMGGVGKSVAAAAFARDCETRRAFGDGIAWLRVGQVAEGTDAEAARGTLMRRTASALGVAADGGTSDAVETALKAHLADRRCLIVIDDVWDTTTVTTVSDVAGPRCRVLVTTRMTSIAGQLDAVHCPVDLLSEPEATALLARSASIAVDALPAVAPEIVHECGYLALAIAMIGAMVRGRPADRWADALRRLREADLEKIRRDYPRYPYPDLLRAIGVSIDSLDAADRERYVELAVFPQAVPIPDAALEALWAPVGVSGADVHDLVDRFVDRSLARIAAGGLLIHDLQHDFTVRHSAAIPMLHARIVESYRKQSPNGWPAGPDDGWFFERLPWHLHEAGLTTKLSALLGDPAWLEAKLSATNLEALIGDFAFAQPSTLTRLLPDALRLSARAVASDPTALRGQLLGRLPEDGEQESRQFRKRLAEQTTRPWLRPLRPRLTPAGAARTRSIPTHGGDRGLATTSDFRLAITAGVEIDPLPPRRAPRARVFEIDTARQLRTIERPHPDRVDVFAIARDQRTLLTTGDDRMLRSWDLETGAATGAVPFGGLVALHPMANGTHALCETGDDVRIVDLRTGATESKYVVEPVRPGGCRLTPDETCAVVADWQGTVRLLEIAGWRVRWSSPGHAQYGTPIALGRTGEHLFVAESDKAVTMLDMATGAESRRIPGSDGDYPITALAVTGDDLLVGMNDGAFQLRDVAGRRPPVTWREHQNRITAIAVSPDGRRALTASYDHSLSVWDIARLGQLPRPRVHQHSVGEVACTSDRRTVVSASGDKRVAAIDVATGTVRTSKPGAEWIQGAVLLPNETHVLTAQSQATLAVMELDGMTWTESVRHEHDGTYHALALVNGGTQAVVAWYIDDLQDHIYGLALWDLDPLRRVGSAVDDASSRRPLHGHQIAWSDDAQLGFSPREHGVTMWRVAGTSIQATGAIPCGRANCVAPIVGGARIAIALDDAIEVWSIEPVARVARTEMRSATVVAAGALAELLVAGDREGGVHVLNATSLEEHARYALDASVSSCAISDDGQMVIAGDENGEVHLLALEQ